MKIIKILYGFLCFLGLILLIFNFIGLFIPLRSSEIYNVGNDWWDDVTLTAQQLEDILETPESSDELYIFKATQVVHDGILHYWEDDKIDQYHLRIPIYENYLLFLFSYKYPDIYEKYEFCNYRKAIARGVGLCSQHAIILDRAFDNQGIASKIVLFPELHVVVTAQVDKQNDIWWVLDPDYGVIIKENLQTVLLNPEIVIDYYTSAGYDIEVQDTLVNIFRNGGKAFVLADTVETYGYVGKCALERRLYLAKWFLPIFLMGVGVLPFVRNKKIPG